MSNINVTTDTFNCYQEEDFAIISILEGAQILSTTIRGKEELIGALTKINDAQQIKGVAVLFSDKYQGDDEYEKFLKESLKEKIYYGTSRYATTYKAAIVHFLEDIITFPKPIIGGVGGDIGPTAFAINLAFDLRIAIDSANFFHPNLKFGLPPSPPLSYFLVESLGPHRATELILTKQNLSAQDALKLGLITQIVSKEELKRTCLDKLRQLSNLSADALLETRLMMTQDLERMRRYINAGFDAAIRCIYRMKR